MKKLRITELIILTKVTEPDEGDQGLNLGLD